MKSYKILLAIGVPLLLVFFQNCGQGIGDGFQVNSKLLQVDVGSQRLPSSDNPQPAEDEDEISEGSTGDICEDQLLAEFSDGYHVFLRNNCAGCHDGNHEAPAFASKSTLASYLVFKDKGYQAVSSNAISDAHNPPATGMHHKNIIDGLKADWEAANALWLQCKGATVKDTSVITIHKSNTNIIASKADKNIWTTMSWNMSTEVPSTSPKFPLALSVELQVATINNGEVGYAVRNPKIKITSGTNKYRVKGLYFSVNNRLVDSATVYRSIDSIVCAGVDLNLAPEGNSQLIVMSPIRNTDKFALQLTSIEKVAATATCGANTVTTPVDTAPARVTFTDLIATTGSLNVFRTQCLSCHQGASASAGLDLSSYTSSKASANKILSRINDANSPMPRSGLMSSQMRAIVEKWVTLGSPER